MGYGSNTKELSFHFPQNFLRAAWVIAQSSAEMSESHQGRFGVFSGTGHLVSSVLPSEAPPQTIEVGGSADVIVRAG